jgi:carboxypeptidase family protein
VLDSGLQVAGASAPLEVVLGVNAPSVTGTVSDSNGKPLPGLAVALVPDAPRRDQYHLYLTSGTSDTGAFTFRNITPGSYKVFVLPAGSSEEVQNPGFLAQNESRGSSVKLAEGKTETLQLTFGQ